MDKLRAAARVAAEWAARSRPVTFPPQLEGSRTSGPDERGQGLAEYALILGLIAVVAIVSLAFLGQTITDLFWAPISDDFGKVLQSILGP